MNTLLQFFLRLPGSQLQLVAARAHNFKEDFQYGVRVLENKYPPFCSKLNINIKLLTRAMKVVIVYFLTACCSHSRSYKLRKAPDERAKSCANATVIRTIFHSH